MLLSQTNHISTSINKRKAQHRGGAVLESLDEKERQNKTKGEREPGNQECSAIVKRNKEKESKWVHKLPNGCALFLSYKGSQGQRLWNPVPFTILCNQTRCLFKNIVGKHLSSHNYSVGMVSAMSFRGYRLIQICKSLSRGLGAKTRLLLRKETALHGAKSNGNEHNFESPFFIDTSLRSPFLGVGKSYFFLTMQTCGILGRVYFLSSFQRRHDSYLFFLRAIVKFKF